MLNTLVTKCFLLPLFSHSMGMVRGLTCPAWETLKHSKSLPYHSWWVIRKICAKAKRTNVPLASRMKILVNYLCLQGDKNRNSKVEWWGGILHLPPMSRVCICVCMCVCVYTSGRGGGAFLPCSLSAVTSTHLGLIPPGRSLSLQPRRKSRVFWTSITSSSETKMQISSQINSFLLSWDMLIASNKKIIIITDSDTKS